MPKISKICSSVERLKRNTRAIKLNAVVIAVHVIVGLCNCALLKWPADRTVNIGEHVILTCQTNLTFTVFWYFNGNEVFYGGKISMQYAEYFKMQSTPESDYNLVIPNATTWYTGIYVCADDEGEGEKRSARLVVSGIVTEAPTGDSTQSDKKTMIIVIVVPSVVVLIIAVVVYFYCCTDKCRQHHDAEAGNQAPPSSATGKKPENNKSLSKQAPEQVKPLIQDKGRPTRQEGVDYDSPGQFHDLRSRFIPKGTTEDTPRRPDVGLQTFRAQQAQTAGQMSTSVTSGTQQGSENVPDDTVLPNRKDSMPSNQEPYKGQLVEGHDETTASQMSTALSSNSTQGTNRSDSTDGENKPQKDNNVEQDSSVSAKRNIRTLN